LRDPKFSGSERDFQTEWKIRFSEILKLSEEEVLRDPQSLSSRTVKPDRTRSNKTYQCVQITQKHRNRSSKSDFNIPKYDRNNFNLTLTKF